MDALFKKVETTSDLCRGLSPKPSDLEKKNVKKVLAIASNISKELTDDFFTKDLLTPYCSVFMKDSMPPSDDKIRSIFEKIISEPSA